MILNYVCNEIFHVGAKYGPRVRHRKHNSTELANLGHAFIAINPRAFTPGFEDRLHDLINYIRDMPPVSNS